MASRTLVTLEDDLTGGTATETVSFGADGRVYEIDLNDKNAAKLRESLAPYIAAGRRAGKTGKALTRTSVGPDPATVRAWAVANGYEVSTRGRVSAGLVEAFIDAGN
jgi:hypothetical protein